MKVSCHKYTLSPQMSLGALSGAKDREGALLRIEWPNEKIGYADLHPWPELGDPELKEHLLGLSSGKISTLAEQSLWLAKQDAILRAEKKNALDGGGRVKSHYTVTDISKITDTNLQEIKSSAFGTIKLKMGTDLQREIDFIHRGILKQGFIFRLDFNAKAKPKDIEKLHGLLPEGIRQKIEFIEDPIPYDHKAWTELAKFFPLAVDIQLEKVDWKQRNLPFGTIVLKPSRQDVEKTVQLAIQNKCKLVVTSALDHPVGVVHATRIANDLKLKYPEMVLESGCATTRLYKPSNFSMKMLWQGPFLMQVFGKGVGFDDLLTTIPWEPLFP